MTRRDHFFLLDMVFFLLLLLLLRPLDPRLDFDRLDVAERREVVRFFFAPLPLVFFFAMVDATRRGGASQRD